VAPPVRVALLDAHGAEIGHTIVRIDAAPVLPGGVQGFAAMIADPGAKAAGVGVDFVALPKAAHAPIHSARPEAAHGEDHAAPAAAHRAPPPAEEGGLRPALNHEVNAPEAGAPVDAHPVAKTPLDSGHGEAVSASHHG